MPAQILDLRQCSYKGKNLSAKVLAGALMSDADFSDANMQVGLKFCNIHTYMYVCICVYVCVCMYSCLRKCMWRMVVGWWVEAEQRRAHEQRSLQRRKHAGQEGVLRGAEAHTRAHHFAHASVHACAHTHSHRSHTHSHTRTHTHIFTHPTMQEAVLTKAYDANPHTQNHTFTVLDTYKHTSLRTHTSTHILTIIYAHTHTHTFAGGGAHQGLCRQGQPLGRRPD